VTFEGHFGFFIFIDFLYFLVLNYLFMLCYPFNLLMAFDRLFITYLTRDLLAMVKFLVFNSTNARWLLLILR